MPEKVIGPVPLVVPALSVSTICTLLSPLAGIGNYIRGWTGLVTALAFSVVVWALTLWLTRGQRTPRDESTAAYLELAIRRSRGMPPREPTLLPPGAVPLGRAPQ